MDKEFCLGNFDKDELRRLITDASEKLKKIEDEERLGYKPSISINETYVSETSSRTILRRVCVVQPGPNDFSCFETIYVSRDRIHFEEVEYAVNKGIDCNIQSGEWKKVDNSVYDMIWAQWEEMNDEIISIEATYGTDALTKLSKTLNNI